MRKQRFSVLIISLSISSIVNSCSLICAHLLPKCCKLCWMDEWNDHAMPSRNIYLTVIVARRRVLIVKNRRMLTVPTLKHCKSTVVCVLCGLFQSTDEGSFWSPVYAYLLLIFYAFTVMKLSVCKLVNQSLSPTLYCRYLPKVLASIHVAFGIV